MNPPTHRRHPPAPAGEEATSEKTLFPPGWDQARVREVLAHDEGQTVDGQFAGVEAAREAKDVTLMAIPTDLVPEVQALLARRRGA